VNPSLSLLPPQRDPAWWGRVFWLSAGLVLLWPLMLATEFRPWIFLEPANLKVTGQFLRS
jgi:phosphonate transport system permease protein